MKILVTDGNTLPSLAITRSLGAAGHEVIVGYHSRHSLASKSKYSHSKCIYPNPGPLPDTFINFLSEFVEDHDIDAIFPVTDITTMLITANIKKFKSSPLIPFADNSIVELAANKAKITALAKSLDIDVPDTIVINHISDLQKDSPALKFPLVIKPSRSRILTDKGWISTEVTYAIDIDQLITRLSTFQKEIFPVLLQEKIEGPGTGTFLCMDEGKPMAAFTHNRLREKPPSGGVSVLRESAPLHPLAYEFSCKLLSEIKWQGVAMVEYKIDNRDNRPKLMEINGRFWGSLQLAIDSGVDFPVILADMLSGKVLTIQKEYKLGVKTRWLWGDIDALLLRLFKSERQLQLPEGFDSKFVYLFKFLKIWEPGLNYDVLKLRDLKPWFYESYLWFKKLL